MGVQYYRKVRGLREARLAENPHPRDKRPRGVRALGLSYERRVAEALPGARHGQWFWFLDNNGPGYCQPDILMKGWILECKLTDTPEAEPQLRELYLPVVTLALGGTWRGLKIVKNIRPWSKGVVGCRADALLRPGISTLHWLGRGPIP